MTPGQFQRHVAKLVDQITDDDGLDRSEKQRAQATLSHGINPTTGMGWIRADLHPDDYQQVKDRLNAEVAALRKHTQHADQRWDQTLAAALVGLITGARAKSTPPPRVQVLMDLDKLLHGHGADGICEYSDGTPLPVETARRHACTADIIPVVLDGAGQPLDVGRSKRQATPAQRHALRAMYRTCAVGGCEVEFDRCEIHHTLEWEKNHGPTDLDHLIPGCLFHHHRFHEGRWRLQLDPSTRQLTVFLPNGQIHSVSYPDRLHDEAA